MEKSTKKILARGRAPPPLSGSARILGAYPLTMLMLFYIPFKMPFVKRGALLKFKLIHTRVLCTSSYYFLHESIVIIIMVEYDAIIIEILLSIIQSCHSHHHHPLLHGEAHTVGKPYHRPTGRVMIESFEEKQGFPTQILLHFFQFSSDHQRVRPQNRAPLPIIYVRYQRFSEI